MAAAVTGAAPGIGRRLASLVYETLVVAAIVLIAALVYPGAATGRLSGKALIGLQLYLVLVTLAYFLWCWRRSGQTLPMKAWRLRLVGTDGGAVTVLQGVARYLIGLAAFGTSLAACVALWRGEHAWIAWIATAPGPAALAWALVDPDRQFLHDRLAGTRVLISEHSGVKSRKAHGKEE